MFKRRAQFENQEGMKEPDFNVDISASLDDVSPVGDAEVGEIGEEAVDANETVTIEIPEDLAQDLAEQINVQTTEETEEVSIEVDDDMPEDLEPTDEVSDEEVAFDIDVEDDMPIQASSNRTLKVAGTPKKVEDISSGVNGKLKSGNGTIGKEQPFSAQKPTIPSRGDASKIRGEKDTIPGASLPDIAQDHGFMGDEANIQKGMPSINIDMRGRVASGIKNVQKIAKTPTKVEDISSGVNGKLKSGNGTIGQEQAFDAKAPNIPEGGAKSKIGGEKRYYS